MSVEDEPSLPLKWGKRELDMKASNSVLYTYLGKTAVTIEDETFVIENSAVNHVYIATSANKGLYFFAEHDPEEFATMSAFIVEHSFPMVINQRHVAPDDLKIWATEVAKEVETFVTSIPDTLE